MKIKKILLLLSVALFSACGSDTEQNQATTQNAVTTPSADRVLTNGKIYTLNAAEPWAEAVAISDGVYVYIGSMDGVEPYIGEHTKVIDLAGKMAMPGINDAHIHPTLGGIKKLFACNFPFTSSPDEIAAKVAQCVAENPDATWIRGGQWDSGFFDTYNIESPRHFLDAVSGDKAVLLVDDSHHNGWGNSKALERAGVTKDTVDPSDGKYVRDPATGEPNGLLLEGAEQAVYDQLPGWSDAQFHQATVEAVRIANQFGITGMKDANSSIQALAAYKAVDESGMLKVHMATSMKTPYGHRDSALDYETLDQLRETYRSTNVHTDFVKIFLDGVPTASRTAAMLAPYTETAPNDENASGFLHITPEILSRDLIELDRRGYTVKIHTAGDRSVRVALDAIAAARQTNGDSGLRHELAHAGYIDDADMPRFASLQVVADFSPYLWHPSPIMTSVVAAVGSPRGERYWPTKSLLQADAPILAGSDWPAAVPSMDPWIGIEAMVTRQDPRGDSPGVFWAEQAISVAQALKIYTLDGAKAMRLDKKTGSIEVGKSADLIVLNHNLFDIVPQDINQTKVLLTLFAGQAVYQEAE